VWVEKRVYERSEKRWKWKEGSFLLVMREKERRKKLGVFSSQQRWCFFRFSSRTSNKSSA
jgi:hypothetical protein